MTPAQILTAAAYIAAAIVIYCVLTGPRRPRLTIVLLTTSMSACSLTPAQLRVAYHGANVVDAGETMARDPACMSEGNPLLGPDPSNGAVALFALGQSLIYEAIYRHIEDSATSNRLAFGRVFLGIKLVAVGWNAGQLSRGCQ